MIQPPQGCGDLCKSLYKGGGSTAVAGTKTAYKAGERRPLFLQPRLNVGPLTEGILSDLDATDPKWTKRADIGMAGARRAGHSGRGTERDGEGPKEAASRGTGASVGGEGPRDP